MFPRRFLPAVVLLLAVAVWLLWPRSDRPLDTTPLETAPAAAGSAETAAPAASAARGTQPAFVDDDFPLAVPLNRPNSTIARDLDTLSQIFDAWRTSFPHDGNPIGENAEITAALTGANRLELALIPPQHPAINATGELCDRWGTPFRFHQLSGTRMEIRSAGPDRTFGTPDDVIWTPAGEPDDPPL